MHRHPCAFRLCTLLVAAAACTAAFAVPAARSDDGTTVTVMTRNLYYGTDLTPVIAAQSQTDFLLAVANAWTQAQATDFAGRARAWAYEIAATHPDLVGLQEAVQWRTQQPADFTPALDATTNEADFVQLLLDDLDSLGLHYRLAAASTGYDVEAPGLFDSGFMDVRLTQHEAILARTDDGLTIANPQSGQYTAMLSLPTALGVSFPLPWSWASVDVTKGGRTFRFATTHLSDTNYGGEQVAQAQEFLHGPAATTLPMIWVGDLNSDANAAAITGVAPKTETYSDAIAAGFRDTWQATRPHDPGYTCCEANDLLNTTPTLDQRIDFVLTHGSITAIGDVLVGNSAFERTLFGHWPSDHAGVVALVTVR